MFLKGKDKYLPICAGIAWVLLVAGVLFFEPKVFERGQNFLQETTYDLQVRHSRKPYSKHLPLLIVDIDDASVNQIARWPWPRDKMAQLTSNVFERGASVVAFDITFPEPQENIVDTLLKALPPNGQIRAELEQVKSSFDDDQKLADALKEGAAVLSYFFSGGGTPSGLLPPPLTTLQPEEAESLLIPNMKSYLGNIAILQKEAKGAGFINASPDSDGVNRFAPLLLRHGEKVYGTLALEAAALFLGIKEPKLLTASYQNGLVLEGVLFEDQLIPTDPWGRILIPYRGGAYSLPTISAIDVINGKVPADLFKDKLVFIGSSAAAMGDLVSTPLTPTFSGVELHASIAAGILENYLPYVPTWGKGVSTGLVLFLGLLCAILFPILGPIESAVLSAFLCGGVIFGNNWLWSEHQIFLSIFFPLVIILSLFLLDLVWSYLLEGRRRKQILSIFGQYLPQQRIDLMVENEGTFGMEGEAKELSVLFADIRGFTAISENMTSLELKKLLNQYLTFMTQIIFNHKGTIDKYVGDLIMAFWGAPIDDSHHALNAVLTALDMQKGLKTLNESLKKEGKPELHIGIGVNTGSMNVGDMGSDFRRAYTVLGDSVNLGSRLEHICRFYDVKIIIGEATYEQVKDYFIFRKLDRVQVRGRGKAIHIFEPLVPKADCLPELNERIALHSRAIEAYFAKDWETAQAGFEELKRLDPTSQLFYQIYLDRLAHFKSTPPDSSWDGVFVIENKMV